MRGKEVHGLAVPAVDIAKLSVADTDGILQHVAKHGLKIARCAADDLEHLRRCRLLLQRFVQLAGEASDICLLASSGRSATGHGLRRNAALELCLLAASPFSCCASCCGALSHCLPIGLRIRHCSRNWLSGLQLIEQRLRLFQIEARIIVQAQQRVQGKTQTLLSQFAELRAGIARGTISLPDRRPSPQEGAAPKFCIPVSLSIPAHALSRMRGGVFFLMRSNTTRN